jgi:hypothetical protein
METKVVELKINTNLDQTNNDVTKLKTNLKGAESGAKDFDKAIGTKKGGSFKELGGAIGDIIPSFGSASQGAGVLNKALLTLVANPIGLVIAGVAVVLGSLYAIFKDFQPLVDKVEQSFAALGAVFNVVKGAFFDVLTGSKSLTEAFGGLGNKASTAAKQTMELVKAQQDLDDIIIANTVTSAKLESQINKLTVQAKNRTLTEDQRLKLLQKAESLETKKFIIEKSQADESLRIARNAFIIKGKLTASENKLIDTNLVKAKEAAEAKGVLIDKEFEALASALKARIAIDDKATSNLEKNQNKQDALFEKQQAKREQEVAAEVARNAKLKADQDKRTEKQIADDKLENERIRASAEFSRKEYEDAEKLIADAKKANDDALKTENQLKVDAENLAFETKKAKLIEANLSIEEIEKQHKANLEKLDLEYWAKESDNAVKATADAKANSDAQIAIAQKLADAKIANLMRGSAMIGQISDLIGQNTAAGKVAAVASATIDTYAAAQSAFKNAQLNPISIIGPAYPYISAGLAIAGGLKNVKSILSVRTPKGGGGSAPSAGSMGTAPTAPSFNVVGTSGQNQIAQTLNREQPPVKAFMVYNDVKTAAAHDRNIVKASSIG